MSFKDIVLPGASIADMYKTSLVTPSSKKQASSVSDAIAVRSQFPGENVGKILIVVNYPDHEQMPAEPLHFLGTILKACDLSIADTVIVNLGNQEASLATLKKILNPKSILLFGKHVHFNEPGEASTSLMRFVSDGVSVISAPELEMLNQGSAESKLLKKELWEQLKELFNVKI